MARPSGSLLLLVLLICHAVALLLFCKGFLLRRVVVPEYSNCTSPTGTYLDGAADGPSSCYPHRRRFQRVVWLIIDALRHDFALYNATLDPSPPVYRNKLPFVRDLLRDHPQNARLFRFVADPPTTTMQRLKALTTGSLPTFIDIGSNFNSHQITEDSLPFQVQASGLNLTFMGDDTWLGLYQDSLTRAFPYPSLNVKDLHTVDEGVIRHMVPELVRGDAQFVVGHFLGVDHVGHTYGSTHWTMGEKLAQMNNVLESIFSAVGEDTIVFVFGDHGMTESGDHGGETELETTAALLVYTPSPLFPPHQDLERAVYQIDIVSTVSLLLGTPIPFSNLGMIIPEVFLPWQSPSATKHESASSSGDSDGYSGRVTLEFLNQLQANAEQIQMYLKTYIKHSEDFPSDVYTNLQNRLASAQRLHMNVRASRDSTQEELTLCAREYVEYMREVKSMCHNVWAKFDDFHINQGLILFSLTLLLTLLALSELEFSLESLRKSLRVSLSLGLSVSLMSLVVSPLPVEFGVASIADVVLSLSFYPLLFYVVIHSLLLTHHLWTCLRKHSFFNEIISIFSRVSFNYAFATFVTVGYGLSLLSNSFILYEGDVSVFLAQSMLICFLVHKAQSISEWCAPVMSLSSASDEKGDGCKKPSFSLWLLVKQLWLLLLAMVLVRLSKVFHACRDLQVGCLSTMFIQPYQGAVESLGGLTAALRLSLSCLGVTCIPLALAGWLKLSGRSRELGFLLSVCVYAGLPLSSLCVSGFWLIQSLPQPTLDSLPHWQHVLLPRIVYTVSLATIGVRVIALLKMNQSKKATGRKTNTERESYNNLSGNGDDLMSMKSTVRHRVSRATSAHIGASSKKANAVEKSDVLGGSTLSVAGATLLVAVWLPVAMVLNDGVALSAVLLAAQVTLTACGLSHTQEQSWPLVVLWGLMSSQFFFGFGHHATVTSLRFDAGFVGLRGEMSGHNLLLAGLLVGLNMLGSHLLLGLALLFLLPLSMSTKAAKAVSSARTRSRLLLTIALQYILFHSFKALVTMAAASLHRRHLMVWGVFSPRFLYEAAFLGITDVSVILATLLLTPSLSTLSRQEDTA